MWYIFFAILFCPVIVFGQEIQPIATEDFVKLLFESMGGLKGASTLAVVAVGVQLLMKFLATPIGGNVLNMVPGKIKLLIFSTLSLVGGVLGLMTSGLGFSAAILHSTTITALGVFAHQVWKQFFENK